jgi:DNA-binding SARP family transcriptional activator
VGSAARRRWHQLVDVAGSALTALLVFAAIPAVLILVVGNPLTGGLGHQWGHLARAALAFLTLVAWVSWVACCAQLLRAVVHHVRQGEVGLPLGAPMTERIAARIAIGILAVTTLGTPLVLASGSGAGAAVTATATVHVGAPPARSDPAGLAPREANRTSTEHYVVRPGDSLWSIADAHLGDGAEWTTIAALNFGQAMAEDRWMVDPDFVEADWSLELPTATAPHAADGAASHDRPEPHRSSTLPELMVLGIGSIGCAALARRARRTRLLRRVSADQLDDPFEPTDDAIDTDILVRRFTGVPALAAFEAANGQLWQALQDRGDGDGEADHNPGVRAISVGPSGVTFWVADPSQPAPVGFTRSADGTSWHVGHDRLGGPAPLPPQCPVVLPIGDDEQGTWLVPVGPGTVLPLLGEGGDALWRGARLVQEAWAWSDAVVVTEDPVEAARAASQVDTTVLFFGLPAALPPEVAAAVAVVTSSTVGASDVSVLVDRHGASIHPLGRTLRPHLMSDDMAGHIGALVSPPAPSESSLPAVAVAVTDDPRRRRRPFGEIDWRRADAALNPGPVEVKLLTVTPRVEGLREEIAPNRARRAVELVAYLALQRPDPVTSERLRTRVLGSSDADAASKTLFNTATAARRALGFDTQGNPLLPPGSRAGHYGVSDEVTVDVQRAAQLSELGQACEEPELAMDYLRAALELVEGEPLANALSGYSWWEVEGHGGRIAASLVHAACTLAALAIDEGLFVLAHWGLERARLVDPYSEALSRTAMQVAAAEGDADRLRREWRECQRRIDEVDPGGSPSPRTERLYGELARQVPIRGGGSVETYAKDSA